MDRNEAEKAIKALFSQYKTRITMTDDKVLKGLTDGKLYELFVVSEVVQELSARGCRLVFQGSKLKFKGGPGMLKTSDPHFTVRASDGTSLWLFVDIEFDTLGQQTMSATDYSRRHEIDIVLVDTDAGFPTFENIWLGVECKAVANFGKDLVKEALGVRRELSLLAAVQPSRLSLTEATPSVDVTANPASEFWLAFIDPKGNYYSQSPAAFGIGFRYLNP
ncbi:MAG: hypothetical protein P4L66_15895 [Acetobacteraceae bacterium]|nr:hypothetical protein [Acetobacteraceae bacterium]